MNAVPWENAGGPDECEHGYARGIPCPRCGTEPPNLSEAYERLQEVQRGVDPMGDRFHPARVAPTLTRAQRRELGRAADRENAAWPAHLVQVDLDSILLGTRLPDNLEEVWRSRRFLVQVRRVPGFNYPELALVSVQRVEDAAFRRGPERTDPAVAIPWDDLQEVKRQIGRGDRDAIEVYPADRDIVKVAPMRHLWLVPWDFLPFAWRAR